MTILAPGWPSTVSAQEPGGGVPAPVAAELDSAIERWAAADIHRGVSAAVVLADGREWTGAAGVSGAAEPLTPDHLIWIASITKTMTGAVVLQLVTEGVIGLDQPEATWLSDVPHLDPRVTVRQLLNHTGGLANYTGTPELRAAMVEDSTHVFTAEELVRFIGPASFEPGARTQYTNTSFLLLGMIAAQVTGTPITDLWATRLWRPLALTEVFLPGYQEAAGPLARTWYGPAADTEIDPLEQMPLLSLGNSAFGLFATARAVARWGRALFSGDVIDAQMRRAMLEFVPAAGNIPGESGAGLAIRRYAYLDREQWGHSGGSPLGSSLLLYDPTTGASVAVLMNQGAHADHFALAPELLAIVERAAR